MKSKQNCLKNRKSNENGGDGKADVKAERENNHREELK